MLVVNSIFMSLGLFSCEPFFFLHVRYYHLVICELCISGDIFFLKFSLFINVLDTRQRANTDRVDCRGSRRFK